MEIKLKPSYDVLVIGAGPAGLAAGVSAHDSGVDTLLVEREARAGGILKQCIHDGFGVITFKEKLSGPEYAERYIKEVKKRSIPVLTSTYVTKIEKGEKDFKVTLVNESKGVVSVTAKALVLSNGCRERTAKQVFITGTRPAGVYTAGTAQYFVNMLGYLPCKKCVILGSGDIGLIMARRLTLEGAKVVGVYEAKNSPSGLSRNIAQCLEDFNIPLHLSHTVTKVFGEDRVEAVEISEVDDNMQPVPGSGHIIECDSVILSVGLIPENELAESLGVRLDNRTKGPVVDQSFMTSVQGVFSCGNALHVNDLVDYVSESGSLAGKSAAEFALNGKLMPTGHTEIEAASEDFLYVVPQKISEEVEDAETTIYFRSRCNESNARVKVLYGDKVLWDKKYDHLKPPEMEKVELKLKEHIEGKIDKGLKLMLERL